MRRIVTYAVLLSVFLIPNGLQWLLSQSVPARMLLYHFFHGNIFHLAANCLALHFLLPKLKGWHFVVSYALACVAMLSSPMPMAGVSNMVYAVIGLRTPSFDSYWWRHPGTRTFIAVTLLMLLVPNVAAVAHIASFAMGVAVSALIRFFKGLGSGSERYI